MELEEITVLNIVAIKHTSGGYFFRTEVLLLFGTFSHTKLAMFIFLQV